MAKNEPSAHNAKETLPAAQLNAQEDQSMQASVADIENGTQPTPPADPQTPPTQPAAGDSPASTPATPDQGAPAGGNGVQPLESYTVKELQAMATGEGVFQAEAFTTKAQLIALIANIRSMKAASKANIVTMFNPAAVGLKGFDQKKIEESWQQKRDRTREALLKQETGSMMIPLDVGEKKGAYMPVIVNGWRLDYMKGVMHSGVPKSIIKVVTDSLNLTAEVGSDLLIDNLGNKIDPVTGQPKESGRLVG